MHGTVITICGDPGGAKALIPVIRLLSKETEITLINYTYNQAIEILNSNDIQNHALSNNVNLDWITQTLKRSKCSLLLTATSHNELNWEKFFISAANQLSIYSISILDFWSNYALRFSDENGQICFLPNKIAVMDERAKNEMVSEGIPQERIIITGQPAFDSLTEYKQQFTTSKKLKLRATLGMKDNDLLVVFISQPISKMYGNKNNARYLGYDEKSVLKEIISSLEAISRKTDKRIFLLIRPHPRERIADYTIYESDKIAIQASMQGDSRDYLMAADLVTGMTSILLMDACYLNCPVISIQPDLKKKDVLIPNALGISIGVYKKSEVILTLERFLLEPIARDLLTKKTNGLILKTTAAKNILEYIRSVKISPTFVETS